MKLVSQSGGEGGWVEAGVSELMTRPIVYVEEVGDNTRSFRRRCTCGRSTRTPVHVVRRHPLRHRPSRRRNHRLLVWRRAGTTELATWAQTRHRSVVSACRLRLIAGLPIRPTFSVNLHTTN